MSYGAKTVSTMTGIPRATLLAWERRYAVVNPNRSAGGHRIYSDDDVAVLRRLKQRTDAGHAIGEAVRLERAAPPSAPMPDAHLHTGLFQSLANYDHETTDRLAMHLNQLSFHQAIDLVYLPILHETGARWASDELTIAQEHHISGWVRERLFSVFHSIGHGPARGPGVVCALAPGEIHEIGLLTVAIKLAMTGWRVTWLGANLPVAELCGYIERESPRLVCLSTFVPRDPDDVVRWAKTLRQAAAPSTVVAVGGPGAVGLDIPGVVVGDDIPTLLQSLRGQAS